MASSLEPETTFRLVGKKSHYSGTFCTAPGCENSSGRDKHLGVKRSYFCYPLADKKQIKLWLSAIPREHWTPTKHSRICSDHFLGETKTQHPNSQGYIPTIFTGADRLRGKEPKRLRQTQTASKAGTATPSPKKKRKIRQCQASPPQPGRPSNPKPSEDNAACPQAVWQTTDHDYVKTTAEHGCMDRVTFLELSRKELQLLLSEERKKLITLEGLTDDEFPVWTGLPNRHMFDSISQHLQKHADKMRFWRGSRTFKNQLYSDLGLTNKPGPNRCLAFPDELFLVLVKLKTGFSNRELQRLFGVSDSYISMLFTTYVHWLAIRLQRLFQMPDVEVGEGVPDCYKDYPGLAVVLDCTELTVEKATNLQARKELYSNYKGRETLKFLIGLSPYQTVNYVSTAWGGRASDKHITMSEEELLAALPKGCAVMTDRGFNISEGLADLGVELIIPCFKGRGRTQMSRAECQSSEQIATARIHIERIIQRVRTFHILDARAKLSMQNVLSEVFICCAYLVNFQLPIVKPTYK